MDKKEYAGVCLFSGSTDSTLISVIAKKRIMGKILLFTSDLGMSEDSIRKAKERAKLLNYDHVVSNGIVPFTKEFLGEAIAMNASYQGYPLGTPMGRAFIVMEAANMFDANDGVRKFMLHGCVKRQNTRVRIEGLARKNKITGWGPLAEKEYTREQKVDLLREYGIPVEEGDHFSTDENIYCRAVESINFNYLGKIDAAKVFKWTVSPEDAPDEPSLVTLVFEKGIPVALKSDFPENHAEVKSSQPLHEIIIELNRIGSLNGIGRIMVIEDTIKRFGEKIVDFYEAPGATIIGKAHKVLEACVLTKKERDKKEEIDKKWAERVYEGDWYDKRTRNLAQEGRLMQGRVDGTVELKLYKGNVEITQARVPNSRLLKREQNRGTY